MPSGGDAEGGRGMEKGRERERISREGKELQGEQGMKVDEQNNAKENEGTAMGGGEGGTGWEPNRSKGMARGRVWSVVEGRGKWAERR